MVREICSGDGVTLPFSPAFAGDVDAPVRLDIPARSLSEALTQLASQADPQILFSQELVEDKRTETVAGRFSAREVLEKPLERAGLEFVVREPDTVVIR